MKYLSVTFKAHQGYILTSLCEYNTETKQKQYISIPLHIARMIIDKETKKEIDSTLHTYRLLPQVNEYFQD